MRSEAVLNLTGICRSDGTADDQVISAPMLYKAISEQLSGDLGGEAVILSLRTGQYYGLNSIGARIWELLQVPNSAPAIEETILSEFEVEPDECHDQVSSFIRLLESEGLIESLNGFASEVRSATDEGKGADS